MQNTSAPKDLKAEHDRYVIKRAKADAQAEIEKQLAKEDSFREQKGRFFGLVFFGWDYQYSCVGKHSGYNIGREDDASLCSVYSYAQCYA